MKKIKKVEESRETLIKIKTKQNECLENVKKYFTEEQNIYEFFANLQKTGKKKRCVPGNVSVIFKGQQRDVI